MNELFLKNPRPSSFLEHSQAFPLIIQPGTSSYQVSFSEWNIPYQESVNVVSIYIDLIGKDSRRSFISVAPSEFYSYFPSSVANRSLVVMDMLGVLYSNYMSNFAARDVKTRYQLDYYELRKVDNLVDVELPDFIVEAYESLKFCVLLQRPRVQVENFIGDINFPVSGVIGGNLDYAHK
nr:hypothetical protein [Pedobacter sp. ASV2]